MELERGDLRVCLYMDSDCYCFIIGDTCQSSADKCEPLKDYEHKMKKAEEAKNPQIVNTIKKVYVCSPYGGKEENYLKAVDHCRYVAAQGHIPFASHVMLHGIMADTGEERERGLAAGLLMLIIVDEIWVFGDIITSGMRDEINKAKRLGKKRVYITENTYVHNQEIS